MRPLPLYGPRGAATQTFLRSGEPLAVLPGDVEDGGMITGRERVVEPVVDRIVDVGDEAGPRCQRSVEVTKPEQAEAGDDLGDRGSGVGHQPRLRKRGCVDPPNRRVNCSCAPIRSAGRSSLV